MTQENVETVRRLYRAFEEGDDEGLLACLSPEVDWYMPDSLPYVGRFRGPQEVRRYFDQLPTYVERGSVESLRVLDGDDCVVVLGHWRSRTVDGVEFDTPFVNVFELRDEKVVRFHAYPDTARILAAFGSS